MSKRAVIISGGEIKDYSFFKNYIKNDDYVICADGGSKHILELGIFVDLFLGDFDSCNFESVNKHDLFSKAEVKRFKIEKDTTDTQIAVEEAIKRGFENIILVAAFGGRMDHMMGNLYLLKYILDNGVRGEMIDEKNIVKLYSSSFVEKKMDGYYISFLPFSKKVEGLTLKGLKYPLSNYTLLPGDTICISNEFKDDMAEVKFESGEILVFISKD